MIVFQIFTVLLPLLLISFTPEPAVAEGAVSPLVLLFIQVACENATMKFHDVLRILVPIGFNAYRLKPLCRWVYLASMISPEADHQAWYYAALALSIINLVLWSYNLFVFLLLRVLPLYFDKIKTPPVDMAYTVVPIPKTNAN